MLKHGSTVQLSEENYSNELLVVYISIAWKINEYKSFSLNEIIEGIFSEKIMAYGHKFYLKVKKTIIEYESAVLKDLDYKIVTPFIFDILETRLLATSLNDSQRKTQ